MAVGDTGQVDGSVSQQSLIPHNPDSILEAGAYTNGESRKSRPESAWFQILSFAGTFAAVLLPVTLGLYSTVLNEGVVQSACLPGGKFSMPGASGIWSTDSILSITLAFGSYDFEDAKIIDVCWDVAVGRGGQAVLAWISYHVFSKAIFFAMRTTEISCDTYAAVAFQAGSGYGTWKVFLDFVRGRFPRTTYAKSTYLAMLFVGLYTMSFPTLMSAMTSYGAISTPVVQHGDNSTLLSDFNRCQAIVRDGSRVNLTDGYIVDWNADYTDSAVNGTLAYYRMYRSSYATWEDGLMNNPTSSFLDGQSSTDHGMSITSQIDVTGKLLDVDSPLLSIINFDHASPHSTCWYHKDVVVTNNDLLGRGADSIRASCDPSLKYEWGFSYLLLFIVTFINAVVALVFYLLYTYTVRQSRKERAPIARPLIWRAIARLAKEVQIATGGREDDVDNKGLREFMNNRKIPNAQQSCEFDPEHGKPTAKLQFVLMALICLLSNGILNILTTISLDASYYTEYLAGGGASIAFYVTFSTVGFIAGLLVNRLGTRTALFVGSFGVPVWISAYLQVRTTSSPVYYVIAGALLGSCLGILWSAQGQIMMSYSSEASRGRYIAFFFGIYNLGSFIGSIISIATGQYYFSISNASCVTLLASSLAAPCLVLTMADPKNVVRSDGTGIIFMRNPTWKSELWSLWKSISGELHLLWLFPMFFASKWSYNYQTFMINGAMSITRSAGPRGIFYWMAHIIGVFIFGSCLDIRLINRRKRALVCWCMLVVLTFAIWGGGYAFQQTRDFDNFPDPYALADQSKGDLLGVMFLYFFFGIFNSAWDVATYWLLGALTNNGRKLANFAGFYIGVQAAGDAISWKVIKKTMFANNAGVIMYVCSWVICIVALLFVLPVVLWRIKDTVPLEEDLKFADQKEESVLPQFGKTNTAEDPRPDDASGGDFEMNSLYARSRRSVASDRVEEPA